MTGEMFVTQVSPAYSPEESALLLRARELAEKALVGEQRSDGSPFVGHAYAVALIVASELGLHPAAVYAVLLHEASCKHPELLICIKQEFSAEVYSMVLGLNRISTIRPNDTRLQAENYRKLIVAYSSDPSVTLIKLADRLEVMRSLAQFSKSQQLRKATETLMLYAPLAHQLGLYHLKSELEDLAFKYSEPESYRHISQRLKATVGEREQTIEAFTAPLEKALKAAGLPYTLKGRTKTAYSIWKKMQAQQVDFEGVYDILAIRFILEVPSEQEKEACWQAYSIVTGMFRPDTRRMRDWLSQPKANGYESLHITVSDAGGRVVEVQIRSRRMDDIAESGLAAHWSYKGVQRTQVLQGWLDRVRGLLQSDMQSSSEAKEYFSQFKLDEVFVFTPNGDLRRLPAQATVLDFAFAVHSNVGVKCSGAKVHGRVVSIREKLHTGDVVEVMTTKNQRPSADWLNIVVTSKAKSKIRQQLREDEGKRDLIGRELLERRMKNWKMELNDEVLLHIMRHFKIKSISDLYAALAHEEVPMDKIKELLQAPERPREATVERVKTAATTCLGSFPDGDYLIVDKALSNVAFIPAKCCSPIQGHEIFGFITAKDGIKLHRKNCPNAQQLHSRYPYRIIEVHWKEGYK
jgi:Guanosine polyphosphate pyrophosphohydrolases/synthetases